MYRHIRGGNKAKDERTVAFNASRCVFMFLLIELPPPSKIYYYGDFDCSAVAAAVVLPDDCKSTYGNHEAWCRFRAEFNRQWDEFNGQPSLDLGNAAGAGR